MMDDLQKRRARNNEVLRRLKNGESLVGNPQSTWFPERPSIKKDPNLIAALYCQAGHTMVDKKCSVCGFSEKPSLKVLT